MGGIGAGQFPAVVRGGGKLVGPVAAMKIRDLGGDGEIGRNCLHSGFGVGCLAGGSSKFQSVIGIVIHLRGIRQSDGVDQQRIACGMVVGRGSRGPARAGLRRLIVDGESFRISPAYRLRGNVLRCDAIESAAAGERREHFLRARVGFDGIMVTVAGIEARADVMAGENRVKSSGLAVGSEIADFMKVAVFDASRIPERLDSAILLTEAQAQVRASLDADLLG